MVKALSVLVLFLLVGCAALGLGAPQSRAIPLGVKSDPEYGRCVSTGFEVDVPPLSTVATITSVCARPYRHPTDPDASAAERAAEREARALGVRPYELEAVHRDARPGGGDAGAEGGAQ